MSPTPRSRSDKKYYHKLECADTSLTFPLKNVEINTSINESVMIPMASSFDGIEDGSNDYDREKRRQKYRRETQFYSEQYVDTLDF